jgi:hypothetical protein
MKTLWFGFCAATLMAAVVVAQVEKAGPAASASHSNEPLRAELLAMKAEDQRVRKLAGPAMSSQQREEWARIDARNQARMETIIAEHGWPGKTLVGPDGASAAWILVQHFTPAFQEKCLPLLKRAVAAGEATGKNYAYLLDRVRMHQGKPQIYGTQFRTRDGVTEAHPIEDPNHLDERRRAVGLGPWADYEKQMLGDAAAKEMAVENPELRQELFRMAAQSREVRTVRLANQTEEQRAERQRVDAAHRARLKEILKIHGWPGRSLIGADAAAKIFLLLTMQDAAFRAESLPLAEQAMKAGQVGGRDYATLVDQVRLEQGRPAVYGMIRVRGADGKEVPMEVEDAAHLDDRRQALGLEPLKK